MIENLQERSDMAVSSVRAAEGRAAKSIIKLLGVGFGIGLLALVGCGAGSWSDDGAGPAPASGHGVEEPAAEAAGIPATLTVASTLSHGPFEFKTGMEAEGFAVDVMELVALELGADLSFSDPVRDRSVLPDLQPGRTEDVCEKVASGEALVGLSSIRASAPLGEGVLATDEYLALDLALVVHGEGELACVGDIGSGAVAVQREGAASAWAAENLPESHRMLFDDPNEALSALVSGNVLACVVDKPVAQRFRKVKAPGQLAIIETVATGDSFVMVVSTDNEELATQINDALATLKVDGRYDELVEAWFGEPSQRGDFGPYTAMPDGPGDMVCQNG